MSKKLIEIVSSKSEFLQFEISFWKLSRSFSVKLLSLGRAAMIRKCHVQLGATYDERVPRGVEGVGKDQILEKLHDVLTDVTHSRVCLPLYDSGFGGHEPSVGFLF